MNCRLAKLGLLAGIICAGLTKPPAQDTSATLGTIPVGMEGSRMVILPGDKLESAPVGDKSKIILRIHDTFPHGNDHRYDLRYFGFVPGEYDLAKFLRNTNGAMPTNLPPITVRIRGILPEDHDGKLIEDETGELSLPGSYTASDHGVAGLSAASRTGTLMPPAGPTCASLLSPPRGHVASDFRRGKQVSK